MSDFSGAAQPDPVSWFREWGTDGEVLFFGKLERRFTPTAQDKLYAASNAVVTQTGATRTVQYLLTDRLGSVDAIAYPSGTLVETRGYDAFGKPRTGMVRHLPRCQGFSALIQTGWRAYPIKTAPVNVPPPVVVTDPRPIAALPVMKFLRVRLFEFM